MAFSFPFDHNERVKGDTEEKKTERELFGIGGNDF